MVGLCGSYGAHRLDIEPMATALSRSGDSRFEFGIGGLRGAGATHRETAQPIAVPGTETRLVVRGTVYSRVRNGSYERRPDGISTGEFCAAAYGTDGIEALTEMNGEFVCVIEERDPHRVRIVTDRLGSRPIYCRATRGTITFSTSVQALATHPGIDTAYEPGYLAEYLETKTVRGLRTPFVGIEQLPPASLVTFDPESGEVHSRRYWQPVYRPKNRSLSSFVDLFIDRFLAAVDDRIREGRTHGLLLSGGSDSRLVLSALDPAETYGFADRSGESEVARRVAAAADVPYTEFDPDEGYYRRLLERNTQIGNLVGWFNEGRAIGVEETLRSEVDTLVSGLYADVLFKGWSLPTRRLSVPGGSIPIPIERRPNTRQATLDTRTYVNPPYLPANVYKRSHARNLTGGSEITDHGMSYPSFEALSRHGFWFPLTNKTSFDRYSDQQVLPTVYPFLDRRLIDLALSLPIRYALRSNLVDRALTRLAPELAAIPHEESGIALSRSRLLHRLGSIYNQSRSNVGGNAAALREMDWLEAYLRDRESTIRALPLVEYEAVLDTYEAHMAGADHTAALFGLVTLLGTPATETLTATEPESFVH